MFAAMRTGSNFLEANLNALPGVACHGELFNPAFIGRLNRFEAFGMDMPARAADPLRMLALMRAEGGMPGFRQFQDHDPRVTEAVLDDPGCAKIILTRNPLESYVSLLIARQTDQWKLTHAKKLRSSRVHFDPEGFEAHLDELQEFYRYLNRRIQLSGQAAFHIDYADLQDIDVLNGLARFLGVEGRLDGLDGKLKKQNPDPISEKVENPEAVEVALARVDRFDFSAIPNFEPRRGLAIPSLVALRDMPLVFMPMQGASEQRVTDWMAGIGDLHERFDWRSFRRWRHGNPGYVGFTVLRHPLARAHDGFCRHILAGRFPDIRRALVKSYGLPLPDPEAPLGIEAHRDLFLGFLTFLKLNLSGQTGLRVAAPFASQMETVQGMGTFRAPDMILRHDRLETGLTHLAAELGVDAPPLAPEEDALFPLSAFVDDEIEAAARDAYRRDYDAFAFADWREG